jgi:hypothetical protein
MLLHLLVLWGFAVVQPTLSVLADSVQYFFPVRRVEGALFVATMVGLAVLPPFLIWAFALALGRGNPLRRWRLHVAAIWLLAALFAAYVARELGLNTLLTLLATPVAAFGFAYAYARGEAVRWLLTALAPAPALFLVIFLGFSDASHLVTRDEPEVAAGAASRPSPVVVYVLDELPIASIMGPDERIDRERFPGFARLADDATWYRTTLAAAYTTFEAVPAILTGKRQKRGRLPIVFDHPTNLFTLLRGEYDEHVMESFTRLCPLSVCPNSSSGSARIASLVSALTLTYAAIVVPQIFERRFPTPGNTIRAVITALRPKSRVDADSFETADLRLFPGPQFDRFLSLVRHPVRGSRRPPLFFLHSNLPHNPYNHLPDGRLYRDHSKAELGLNVSGEQWANHRGATLQGWQRHLLQTQFADKLVGELVRRLEREGMYDETLLVVVADHGASFIPGSNRRKPRPENISDIAMVPLFVKAPGQDRGRVEDRPLSTIDVLPTIADVLGMRIPWRVDGQPARLAVGDAGRRLTLLNEHGAYVPLDPAALRRQRRGTLARKARLFGPGSGPPGVFGLGPARRLQGRLLARVPKGRPIAARVELRDDDDFEEVDLRSPFLPALVRGEVRGGGKTVGALAIAVNGRIAGSGFTFPRVSGAAFEVMVDPRALRDGRNRVQVLAATERRGVVHLHPFRAG